MEKSSALIFQQLSIRNQPEKGEFAEDYMTNIKNPL